MEIYMVNFDFLFHTSRQTTLFQKRDFVSLQKRRNFRDLYATRQHSSHRSYLYGRDWIQSIVFYISAHRSRRGSRPVRSSLHFWVIDRQTDSEIISEAPRWRYILKNLSEYLVFNWRMLDTFFKLIKFICNSFVF